jgi:hypothetical protein
MKQPKPSMSFSELVYAINNRGKSMNLKNTKALVEKKAVKEEPQVLDEGATSVKPAKARKLKPVN